MIVRTAAGALLAAIIAIAALRSGSLDRGGAISAVVLGTIAMAAGWDWGAFLIIFFLATTLLSRMGSEERARRIGDVLQDEGRRDTLQVLANGGIFGTAALLWLATGWPGWLALGAGSLAAATADTWGTEVGTLSGSPPRLVTTWEAVPAGLSGAVTLAGVAGSLLGATFLALVVAIAGWRAEFAYAAALGGISGAFADSYLGARWQQRRRCPSCETLTERHVHRCGTRTEDAGGVAWLDNDAVNFAATAVGGAVALAFWMTR